MPHSVLVFDERETAADPRITAGAVRAALDAYDADPVAAQAAMAAVILQFDAIEEDMEPLEDAVRAHLNADDCLLRNDRRVIADVKLLNGIVLGMYLQRELDKAVIRG